MLQLKISRQFNAQVISVWMRLSKASTRRLDSARVWVRLTGWHASVNVLARFTLAAAVGCKWPCCAMLLGRG